MYRGCKVWAEFQKPSVGACLFGQEIPGKEEPAAEFQARIPEVVYAALQASEIRRKQRSRSPVRLDLRATLDSKGQVIEVGGINLIDTDYLNRRHNILSSMLVLCV